MGNERVKTFYHPGISKIKENLNVLNQKENRRGILKILYVPTVAKTHLKS